MIKPIKNVVITGPESTGKSTLTSQLAEYYNTTYIPEYARTYIEKLNRPYCYDDLVTIARKQIQDLKEYQLQANKILFIDTYLIITKVWFEVVYNSIPDWLNKEILQNKVDLYLLCDIDIPWEPDGVRENGGKMRELLFEKYKVELTNYGFNFCIINGSGTKRLESAIKAIETFGL
jgi:NadR type nicotinamide-nucleotide adenylyltransferase